jgi:hypothetical protein
MIIEIFSFAPKNIIVTACSFTQTSYGQHDENAEMTTEIIIWVETGGRAFAALRSGLLSQLQPQRHSLAAAVDVAVAAARQTLGCGLGSSEPLMFKNDLFTKTGSGQT